MPRTAWPSKWTPEQRAEAVTLWHEHGLAEASRRTGIPKASISRWLSDADRVERNADRVATASAVVSRVLSLAERRSLLAERHQTEAEKLIERLWAPITVYHWGTVTDVDERGRPTSTRTEFMTHDLPIPTIGDQKTLITAISIAITTSLKLTGDDPKQEPSQSILVKVRQALLILPPEQRAAMAEHLALLDKEPPITVEAVLETP